MAHSQDKNALLDYCEEQSFAFSLFSSTLLQNGRAPRRKAQKIDKNLTLCYVSLSMPVTTHT